MVGAELDRRSRPRGNGSNRDERWFERLLAELKYERWIGGPAAIETWRVRKQKNDRQEAELIAANLPRRSFSIGFVEVISNVKSLGVSIIVTACFRGLRLRVSSDLAGSVT